MSSITNTTNTSPNSTATASITSTTMANASSTTSAAATITSTSAAATTTSTTTRPRRQRQRQRQRRHRHRHHYTDEELEVGTIGDCMICYNRMTIVDRTSREYICEHIFHTDCITPWHKESFLCPCCRARIARIPWYLTDDDSRIVAMRNEYALAVAYQDRRNDQEAFVARLIESTTRDRSGR